jgi:virginiamycin B lyase
MKNGFQQAALSLTFCAVALAQPPQPTLQELPLPAKSFPEHITLGPDGAVWFTEEYQIGRIAVDGTITEYPAPGFNPSLNGICTGPDGAIWLTDGNNRWIVRLVPGSPLGVSLYPTSLFGIGIPESITSGSDGARWFTESPGSQEPLGNNIGRITTAGVITAFPLPANSGGMALLRGPTVPSGSRTATTALDE